jgi:DNA sulfur modification protein DndE
MKLTKLRLTKDASNRLRFLAGKTGLTPNLLCRIGFCLSLGEPIIPNPDEYTDEDREFNRYTLLGEYDTLFVALLKQRCHDDGLSEDEAARYFGAHMNRGVILLQQRAKGLSDIAGIIPASTTILMPKTTNTVHGRSSP